MTKTTQPSKQLVRDFMDSRTRADDPPPTPEEIRRELGWHLLPNTALPDADE